MNILSVCQKGVPLQSQMRLSRASGTGRVLMRSIWSHVL